MRFTKHAISLCTFLLLSLPGISSADVKIIYGAPHYKHYVNPYSYNRHPYSYRNRGLTNYANSYYRRHNFANPYRSYNPYLNNSYSYDKIRQKRYYNNSVNNIRRYNYGYRPYSPAKNAYRKGYNRGFRDGYNRSNNKPFSTHKQ